MRKLYDLVTPAVDDSDKTRACGQHCFFCIFWTPICIKCRGRCVVEPNGKNLREFFDAKRAYRHRETSEESLSIFSFLLVDA
jgi:hypothetical protein